MECGNMKNKAICITAGEQSENHSGMEINGNGLATEGFTIEDLLKYKDLLEQKEIRCEYYRLDEDKTKVEPAGLLIIRNGVKGLIDEEPSNMLVEQLGYKWDMKYWDTRRKRVLNLRARYNVCYGNEGQEPNYEEKKGTIISYTQTPILDKWRKSLKIIFGEKCADLEVEGNYYYNTDKCGIGFHGDAERKKVIACSLGTSRPIHWQWYHYSKPIGKRFKLTLNSGDMYIMSEKTTGYDWKLRSKKTLRHAAGEKYVNK